MAKNNRQKNIKKIIDKKIFKKIIDKKYTKI